MIKYFLSMEIDPDKDFTYSRGEYTIYKEFNSLHNAYREMTNILEDLVETIEVSPGKEYVKETVIREVSEELSYYKKQPITYLEDLLEEYSILHGEILLGNQSVEWDITKEVDYSA